MEDKTYVKDMEMQSAKIRTRENSPKSEVNRQRSTGIRTMDQANRSVFENFGFSCSARETPTKFVRVDNMDSLGMARKTEPRPARK